ncbi:MAG: hypothetical protein JWP45_86 [Mucilaginibacter sp.]|nr:hypothetical protein [Mucilaginibacter sp.]
MYFLQLPEYSPLNGINTNNTANREHSDNSTHAGIITVYKIIADGFITTKIRFKGSLMTFTKNQILVLPEDGGKSF